MGEPRPTPDDVRCALASLRQAGRGVEGIHEEERPEGVLAWTRQTFEGAVVRAERLARDRLVALVEALAGPAPSALIIDGELLAIGGGTEGMAIVPADRIVTL